MGDAVKAIRYIILLICFHASAFAAPIKLAWDAPSGESVTGYRIYLVSRDLGIKTQIARADTVTATVQLDAGDIVGVTAHDSVGRESELSNLVTISDADVLPPVPPVIFPSPPATVPARVKITLFSSPDVSRTTRREEANFHQPIEGPARFWWAEITPSPSP